MALCTIIDKSAFQSLSSEEIIIFNKYYLHNITPILISEILGDLSKETHIKFKNNNEKVKNFAKRLFFGSSFINSNHAELIKSSITGNIEMDGRPIVDIHNQYSGNGLSGGLIEYSYLHARIDKWKLGIFNQNDFDISNKWRKNISEIDNSSLLEFFEQNFQIKISTIEEIFKEAQTILTPKYSKFNTVVSHLFKFHQIPSDFFYRVTNINSLKHEFPYLYFIFQVDILFALGLKNEIFKSSRKTDLLDLIYIYYLPFCKIFVSDDYFHKKLVPLLLREDQKFIVGTNFKEDLKKIKLHFQESGLKPKDYPSAPPKICNSLSHELWDHYFDLSIEKPNNNKPVPQYVLDKLHEIHNIIDNNESTQDDCYNSNDFIVKNRHVTPYSECYCGSGKQIVGCCLTLNQFDKILKEDYLRRNFKR